MEELMGGAKRYVYPIEPLNLMYIASYLEMKGFSVGIMDAFALDYTEDNIFDEIERLRPRMVGFSVVTSQAFEYIKISKRLKKEYPDIFVIAGNVHSSIFYEYFLSNKFCDLVVHDEGEVTMANVARAVLSDKSFKDIKGISYRDSSGEIVKNQPIEPLDDLDELPQPAWDLIYMKDYKMQFYVDPLANRGKYFAQLITSRGCPFRCKFCSVHFSRKVRFHSVERVIEDIKRLHYDHGVKFIMFHDANFMINKQRLLNICRKIIEENIKIKWGCEGRVDFAVNNPDVLPIMKKAGCRLVSYGIESGSQKILDSCNKGTNVEQIEKAIDLTKKNKIRSFGLFILGLPEDDMDTCEQTINFARKLPLDLAQFSIFVPFPGSPYYDELVDNKIIDEYDWNKFIQYHSFKESEELIYSPPGMDYQDLIQLQKKAFSSFYLRPKIIARLIFQLRPTNIWDYLHSFYVMLKSRQKFKDTFHEQLGSGGKAKNT
jgi:radical SAM superfamily enzyme YgiQ (UPF0313 family)